MRKPIKIPNFRPPTQNQRLFARAGGKGFDVKTSGAGKVIEVYDEIGGFGVTAQAFSNELKSAAGDVTVKINSPGGDFFSGVAIAAMPDSNYLTFLVTAQGKPFTAAGFGNHFRDLCDAAKLPPRCTSHGLRKAAATYFAELGATDHQLMAWFGWSSISQAQVYTKAANRKLMAMEAGKLIPGTGIGSPINQVSQTDHQLVENTGGGK
jgi:hypothetical protein